MSLVLIVLLTCLICYFIHVKWNIFAVGSRIPGPVALPLVGNVQMICKLKPECKCLENLNINLTIFNKNKTNKIK